MPDVIDPIAESKRRYERARSARKVLVRFSEDEIKIVDGARRASETREAAVRRIISAHGRKGKGAA